MTDALDRKLADARKAARGYGEKRALAAVADDMLKGVYASLMDQALNAIPEGTVAEKDAWIRRREPFKQAIEDKRNYIADWETAKLYIQILFAEVEKYRTDSATARSLDKLHT